MSVKLAHFEWLLSEQDGPEASAGEPFPSCPGGRVSMEQVSVLGDIDLYVFNGRFDEPQTLRAADERPGRPLGMILVGAGQFQFQPAGCDRPCGAGRDTLVLHAPEAREARYDFAAGQAVELAALTVGPKALHGFLAADRPPALLRGVAEEHAGTPALLDLMAPSPALAAATRHMLGNPYRGPARRLFFEAKILEAFAELRHRLDGDRKAEPAMSAWERARVFEARDLLACRLADPPALAELARLVNLPAKRLNHLFREVFGTTPFAWVRDSRLALARQLLAEERLPIKQVAHRLGYANVHNFTHAFTARFGIPPGAARGRTKKGRGG